MHRTAATLLLAFALLVPLAATAQEAPVVAATAPVPVVVVSDESGDVTMTGPNGVDMPYPKERMANSDIVEVRVTEEEQGFRFDLSMAGGAPSTEVPGLDTMDVRVLFRHEDVRFGVRFETFNAIEPTEQVTLEIARTDDYWDVYMTLDGDIDPAEGTATAFVPRRLLQDNDGAMPALGRQLSDFSATADGTRAGLLYINDQPIAEIGHVHDDATGVASLPVVFGVAQTGNARLYSDRPFRASNGEAGSFVYELRAVNLGKGVDTFAFTATGVPPGWQVTIPRPELMIDGDDELLVPIVATVPFQHAHGGLSSFVIEMTSVNEPGSVGRILLGFAYTSPAQPGGHHPILSLHSRGPDVLEQAIGALSVQNSGRLWMNTNLDDLRDQGVDVPGEFNGIGDGTATGWGTAFVWRVPLSPGLEMGLDFDLEQTTEAEFTVQSILPMPGAKMSGAVYVHPYDEFGYIPPGMPAVATLTSESIQDIGANAEATFKFTVQANALGDYIGFTPGNNLYLVLNLTSSRPATITAPEAPNLRPGGTMTLPLLEYQDNIEDVFATLSTLSLASLDGTARVVPPGASTSFDLELTAPEEGTYVVRALGPNAAWVAFDDGTTFDVGETLRDLLRVRVAVPKDAPADIPVDLVIEATSQEDESLSGIQMLRITVDPTATANTTVQGPGGGGKASPVAGVVGFLPALAAVAWVARRRVR